VDDQSILLQLLGVPPSTPSPTPEQMDAHEQFARGYQATGWRRPARKTLESVQDLLLGALGFPTEAPLSKGAELFSAAIPVFGGAKSALAGTQAMRKLVGGFYSRLDEAAGMLPKKGVPAPGVMNWLKKSPEGISPEEAAYRNLPEFLQAQGQAVVTPEALRAHLEANPAPFPKVKTLGGKLQWSDEFKAAWDNNELGVPLGTRPSTPDDFVQLSERLERQAQRLQARGANREASRLFRLSEESMRHAEGIDLATGSTAGQPKFAKWQVPGGEQYRETLLTHNTTPRLNVLEAKLKAEGKLSSAEVSEYNRLTDIESFGLTTPHSFSYSHYPDDPNILVHTRANDRTLPTGERGRFVEEVQSDWHQKGEKAGYQTPEQAVIREKYAALRDQPGGFPDQDPEALAIRDQLRALKAGEVVPDAPFKDTWPDLGYKQQLIEAANDPQAEWIGFTGGRTQANRYDLSKHISEVHYSGTNLKAYDLDGNVVIQQTGILPADLPDYIGKEAADKLLSQPKQGTLQSLTGLDLKMGGEGMEAFYDKKLPKRVEKIVKPYGGTVESVEVAGEPSWITRLTPDMKAAIKRGVPLMSILAAAVSAGLISQAEADQLKAQGYQ